MIPGDQRETKHDGISMTSQMETSLSSKQKVISPLEERKENRAKKPRRQEEVDTRNISDALFTRIMYRSCVTIFSIFMTLGDLDKHISLHHVETHIQWRCIICGRSFPKLRGVRCHVLKCSGPSESNEGAFKCEACP
jgi:ribosome-interacting GTPase 1